MTHLFALNPAALPRARTLERIIDCLKAAELPEGDRAQVHLAAYPRDVFLTVRALEADRIRLYAIGGGGILFDCVNAAALYPRAELAILPPPLPAFMLRGGGPHERALSRDIAALSAAPVRSLGLMRCGKVFALDLCLIGTAAFRAFEEAKARRALAESRAGRYGADRLCRLAGRVAGLMSREAARNDYSIRADGEAMAGQFSDIRVENAFPGGAGEEGAAFLRLTVRDKRGEYVHPVMETSLGICKKVTVRSENLMRICLDGECFTERRVSLESAPNALRLVTRA